MPIHNRDVAEIFNEIADLLDIKGDNPFRIRSYRQAARTVYDLTYEVSDLVEKGTDLSTLEGIGKDLASKIVTIVHTGRLEQLYELRKDMASLRELMGIGSLGPKRIKLLHDKLDINSLDDLQAAIETGSIRTIRGFGPKIEESILRDLQNKKVGKKIKRLRWDEMEKYAQPLVKYLKQITEIDKLTIAGSYRRKLETIGDLDILITCNNSSMVMQKFTSYDEVARVIAYGETRSSVILQSGIQVDIRVVAPESYGAAVYYFTGSKTHNIEVRKIALKKNLKINEYGVFSGNKKVAGFTEEEVFEQVGLQFIEPELRENRGEIEAAQKGTLPQLITTQDIRGDLHVHTRDSDGHADIDTMADAAIKRGLEYIAITDHSKRVAMVKGLDEIQLRKQCKEIDRSNATRQGFQILKSCEVDILEDGSLDIEDSTLKELDIVICSVHYNLNLPEEKQTERIIRAMDNRYFGILAHPTGRLIGSREPYQVNIEKIMRAAHDRGCFLELNASPERLDLNDLYCHMAKEIGVKIAISTDSHTINGLDNMKFGIAQARRGWLCADNVLNTYSWKKIETMIQKRR
jgi:DNA polymerase (family 10)